MSRPSLVEEIFLAALERPDLDQRAAYLEDACRGDAEVRAEVDRLLQAHPAVGKFLETAAEMTADFGPRHQQAGSVIGGRYKLLEPIGEGGMGSVWMAQQTEPVRRQVALKLIKAGMDTRTVLARFEAERQALALMDHPNIARVLDAGASDEGRPYFVMELVKGVPITRYCDERRLTLRQRLDLFIPVCQAVQHAHQKGVIHRDLKPSNVLVARYDDRPVPKVIDFGVAKAAGQPLTDKTLATGFGAVVGTPEYMSPEQAQFNQLDVDTRSDIYALGVLLYELLTGSTPVSRKELERAGLLEILRMIREQDPPRPSTRLSTAQGLPKIASDRGSEPKALAGLLRNDLDWIVMKALEKDRNRRYETATGLAADVQRYLSGEAVQAHPPSAAYRLRKFTRKHRGAIATASAFVGLLVVAICLVSLLAIKAMRAESNAKEKEDEATANANLYQKIAANETVAVNEAKLSATGLQIDLDLAEAKTEPVVGLLRLARTATSIHNTHLTPDYFHFINRPDQKWPPSLPLLDILDGQNKLYAFAAMAILARGQDFARLIPPVSHDGQPIRSWDLNKSGDRLLTLGEDGEARLWDAADHRPIVRLRKSDEAAVAAGLSPDGATAFTCGPDGVVRLWETRDGSLRAETQPRPDRLRDVDVNVKFPARLDSEWNIDLGATQLSNDRVLTYGYAQIKRGNILSNTHSRPVELWDARTGRLIKRLDRSDDPNAWYAFFGQGRWIVMSSRGAPYLDVFSAETGEFLSRLDHARFPDNAKMESLSPSGNVAATTSWSRSSGQAEEHVHLWDTKTWRLITTVAATVPPAAFALPEIQLIGDDQLEFNYDWPGFRIFHAKEEAPIASGPSPISRIDGDRAMLKSGQLVDTRAWRRLLPPKGRKYHPDLARFAPDGRFLMLGEEFVDTTTEKSFPLQGVAGYVGSIDVYRPKSGWVGQSPGELGYDFRLPADLLKIPEDLLQLWAQVAVRGELDDQDQFVKWDESTWERKRRELASKPIPDPNFPFPGHLAVDRLHWLRREYTEKANAAEAPALARRLLEAAEKAGDKAEAAHWRAILAPKPTPK